MTRAQLFSLSAGVALAAALPNPRWSLDLGLALCALAGGAVLLRASSLVTNTSIGWLRGGTLSAFCAVIASLGVGLCVAGGQFYTQKARGVNQIEVTRLAGCIVSRITNRNDTSRFVFLTMSTEGSVPPLRYRVSWRQAPQDIKAGDCLSFSARLKPLRGTVNEVGFDYERWLFSKQLHGVATVRNKPVTLLSARSSNALYLSARETVYARVAELSVNHVSGPLIAALAVGIRDQFTEHHWTALKRSGTAHLMAISGLHVGLAAMFGYWIGRYCPLRLRRSANLTHRGAVTALAVACLYAAVAGFSVSTVRALIMLSLWYFWRQTQRSVGLSTTLLLTVAIVLLVHPWMVMQSGFWLSAGAVAAIGMAIYGRSEAVSLKSKVLLAVRIQIGLTLLMMPVSLVVAGGVSWISVPVNLVLIPVFSVCVVPLVLLLLLALLVWPTAAPNVAALLGSVLDVIWLAVTWLATQPWAYTQVPAVSLWLTVPVCLCGFLLLLPPAFPVRVISAALVLPLFFVRAERPQPGEFQLDVLDVGQALSVVIQTHSHTVVYDTGNAWPGSDSAQQTLLPLLDKRRVEHLQALVVSHADRDHAGGALSVATSKGIGALWVGEPVEGLENAATCVEGHRWQLDGVWFEFLHPPPLSPYEGNQQSCVLLVEGDGAAALLTGDLGDALERRLLPRIAARSIDLVVGAHHGSLTSSDPLFVRTIEAQFAVFSNGFGNQWGMPRAKVVERWTKVGTKVLTTAQDGQLRFESRDGRPLKLVYRAREAGLGVWRRRQ